MDANVLPGLEPYLTPIDALSPHPEDPFTGDLDVTAAWLARTGQHRPIVATKTGVIVKGADTYRAAVALGWTHVAATLDLDADPARALAMLTTHHRTSDLGGYDEADLAALLAPLDYGMAGAAGFTPDALDALLAAAPASAQASSTDAVPDSAYPDPFGAEADSDPSPAPATSAPSPGGGVVLRETVLLLDPAALSAVAADLATLADKWGAMPHGPLVLRALKVAAAPYL